jgi:2-aminoethylphosphonate-pyruvate transaminase
MDKAQSETGDPLLLTPGPLTTAKSVKASMVHDWGSRDAAFLRINREVLDILPTIVGGGAGFVTVPMQGSGTFAVEAMLTTFVPPDGTCLLLVNGAYGQRARRILEIARRGVIVHETPEDTPPDLVAVEALLKAHPAITHVFAVHCETTSGIRNPVEEIGGLAHRFGKSFLLDAMSAFGALPLDVEAAHVDAVAASSNKCIEGVPGLGFVVCRTSALERTAGHATTLVLDLHDQWRAFGKTGQYRFTPPIHVIVAFHQALSEFMAEGGQPGRLARYRANAETMIGGMRALGFETLLPDALQAPIIVTFHMPKDKAFVFQRFYDALKDRGFVIYPGKLTVADSFRVGCIGRLFPKDYEHFVQTVADILREMGVRDLKRAA